MGTSTCTSTFVPANSSAYGASFWRRHRCALAEASSWSTSISRLHAASRALHSRSAKPGSGPPRETSKRCRRDALEQLWKGDRPAVMDKGASECIA